MAGREKSEAGKIIDSVVADTGVNKQTLREALWRREQAEKKAAAVPGSGGPPGLAVPVDGLGKAIPGALLDRWDLRRRLTDEIGAAVRQINTKLGELEKDCPTIEWNQTIGQFKAAWAQVALRRPFALCACKDGGDCAVCCGQRFVGEKAHKEAQRFKVGEMDIEEVPF